MTVYDTIIHIREDQFCSNNWFIPESEQAHVHLKQILQVIHDMKEFLMYLNLCS